MMKKKNIQIIAGILLLIIGVLIVGSRFLKDGDVKNVFDEIYYSGAPSSLNYYLTTSASMLGTGCIKRRIEGPDFDLVIGDDASESFYEKCLWEDKTSVRFLYFKEIPLLIFSTGFIPSDEGSKNAAFLFRYRTDTKELIIDYAHAYFDKSRKIDTDETHKIPEAFYIENNTTREAMIAEADKILYQHLLPLYFDKNKENSNHSRFSVDDLGKYTVNYHF